MELNQVHDIQKAYRKVLNTFSYPGKIESLQEEMKKRIEKTLKQYQ